MGELIGKVAIVTGSTSGIGLGVARKFLDEGAAVVIHGRDARKASDVVRSLVETGIAEDRLKMVTAEIAEPDECKRLVNEACRAFDGVDILVNNAADFRRGTLETTDCAMWDYQMHVNLRAPFLLVREVLAPMRARGGGSIINMGSVNAYVGQRDLTAYSVSKGGLMTLTRNAAIQLACPGRRVRVNQVNVGWTLTEGEVRVQQEVGADADWAELAAQSRPMGRLLSPDDVAEAVLYFAGPRGEAVSGSVLDLEQFPVWHPPVGPEPSSSQLRGLREARPAST